VLVFASDVDVAVAEVEAWADAERRPEVDDFEDWRDVSVSTGDWTAVVEGTTDTADAFDWGDSLERSGPQPTTAGAIERVSSPGSGFASHSRPRFTFSTRVASARKTAMKVNTTAHAAARS
jgi:hypothetical protein